MKLDLSLRNKYLQKRIAHKDATIARLRKELKLLKSGDNRIPSVQVVIDGKKFEVC
jgi:hypothetical protein